MIFLNNTRAGDDAPFHKTLQLMNIHCQIKLVTTKWAVQNIKNTRNSHDFITAMNPNSVTVTLTLATHFSHMTLAYNDVSPYWVWLQ